MIKEREFFMEDTIYIGLDEIEIMDIENYNDKVIEHFSEVPEIAKPLLKDAKRAFKK